MMNNMQAQRKQIQNLSLHTMGNYRFTQTVLGKGNFAWVEEAVHTILKTKVAVKILDVKFINEDYIIKNLHREARLMSKMNHPCIAALFQTMQHSLHDTGNFTKIRSDRVYYLVTELVSGGDLVSFIKAQRNGKLEERSTRIYARQFVSAISHMHGQGVVHRDLKMENVMLNAAQTQIKIVDFGLSNIWKATSPLLTHCGSPEYAAPELFVSGRQYGPEVDLWSLGIIFYGMVVGQLPFVTNRNDGSSSPERRKRLVFQINKGLTIQHRRSIAGFSVDFRNMLNQMLNTDAPSRITIKQLIFHPWITENRKKFIRTNPLPKLDDVWEKKILQHISTILDVDLELIQQLLKLEPRGKVGGMFNILMRKHTLNQLDGDGITQCLELPLRSPPTRMDFKKSKPKSAQEELRRVTTAQNRIADFIDYRQIHSPVRRRKAYSASVTAKRVCNTPVKKSILSNRTKEPVEKKPLEKIKNSNVVKRAPNPATAGATKKKPIVKLALRPATAAKIKQEKALNRSDSAGMKRAVVTAGGNANRDRLQKCNIVSPNTVKNSGKSIKNEKVLPKRVSIEKPRLGCGDIVPNKCSNVSRKHPVMYDPIAKTIAGYMTNTNMPVQNVICCVKH